ncbi:methyl-accepting chemotaxis protein [Roseateles sp.]|uniref:methyl-accepting chemotaxis protein n=1 Tax=Roseateles sp. TaxID=1971397 RepID=UPI0031D2A536
MRMLSDLKVGVRLGMGFALLVLLMLAMGAFSASRVAQVEDRVEDLATNWLPSTRLLGAMGESMNQMRRAELQMLVGGDAKAVAEEAARLPAQWKLLPEHLAAYDKLGVSERERQVFDELVRQIQVYRSAQERYVRLLTEGQRESALALLRGDSRAAFRVATQRLSELVAINGDGAAQAHTQAREDYRVVLSAIWTLVAAAMALGALVGWLLTRSMTQPLRAASAAADRIAGGDLRDLAAASRRDELGDLLRALGRMRDALHASVSTVRSSADQIAEASREVATGSSDLSARTEQAASNLEQTSAAMHQLTDAARHSASTAGEASRIAQDAAGVATRGGDMVGRVVETMSAIQQSSRRIADIIGVIDGIAFQTNILALNAAVEAARAGEQGRGFAVVASEVRGLAQRSAQAAREIKALIADSVEQVETGSRAVDDAGSTMSQVVEAVKQVHQLIRDIAAASGGQTQSLTEVNAAVSQLDGMTQQNAALVEESAAAAEALRDQAAQLSQVVARFRLSA